MTHHNNNNTKKTKPKYITNRSDRVSRIEDHPSTLITAGLDFTYPQPSTHTTTESQNPTHPTNKHSIISFQNI